MSGLSAFLVAFDRRDQLATITRFADTEEAISVYNERELEAAPHIEVVLLFAESEEQLHRTHSRYFHDIEDIVRLGLAPLREERLRLSG